MQNPLSTYDSSLEELTAHITDLEQRVSILEAEKLSIPKSTSRGISAIPAVHAVEGLSSIPAGALTAIGKGLLGIAGAYILRALSESGTLPQLIVVIIAIAYAALWLVWANRAHDGKFESAIYGATAALIFSPMIGELTLRFNVLSPGISAGALLGFVVLVEWLAWKRRLSWLVWAATPLPIATAVVLQVATRDPAPFVFAVLLMASVVAYASFHDRWPTLSIVVALLADIAAILLIAAYSGENGYKPISTVALLALTSGLFLVYGGSTVISTVVLVRTISWPEVGQVVAAFLIAILHAIVTHHAALPLVAVFCLVAGFACYWTALTRFDKLPHARNYHVFAAWGAALLLTGTFCFESQAAQSLSLDLVAAVAVFAAFRLNHLTLGFHGLVYLGVTGFVSGLWTYTARALVGPWPPAPRWTAWVTAVSAIVCCAVLWRAPDETPGQRRTLRNPSVLRLIFSSLIAYAGAASLVSGIVWLFPGRLQLYAPVLAMLRTLVVCVIIVVSSVIGSRWNRIELTRIAYGAIGLCALKLLFEDLRLGTPGSLAVSLLFYGSVFVVVPRLGRAK